MGHAERAIPGLIEWLPGERYIEDGVLGSEAQIDENVGPGVVEVEGEGAAGEGPEGAVCASGLVYVGAWGVLGGEIGMGVRMRQVR